jgi:hypothetical protein
MGPVFREAGSIPTLETDLPICRNGAEDHCRISLAWDESVGDPAPVVGQGLIGDPIPTVVVVVIEGAFARDLSVDGRRQGHRQSHCGEGRPRQERGQTERASDGHRNHGVWDTTVRSRRAERLTANRASACNGRRYGAKLPADRRRGREGEDDDRGGAEGQGIASRRGPEEPDRGIRRPSLTKLTPSLIVRTSSYTES